MNIKDVIRGIKKRPTHEPLHNELFILAPVMIEGEITIEDDIMIDTSMKGNIASSGHLTIGPSANITGNASARTIHHQGSLQGVIKAQDTAIILGGSSLNNSCIMADKVDIQPGSQLNNVKITTN